MRTLRLPAALRTLYALGFGVEATRGKARQRQRQTGASYPRGTGASPPGPAAAR